MTDINNLSYTELLDLQKQVKTAVEDRKKDEGGKAKKAWLNSAQAVCFAGRIDVLRSKFEKLAQRCNKNKTVTLRVQLNVDFSPLSLDEVLTSSWDRDVNEIFPMRCSGKLLNPKDCGSLAKEIQTQIDCIMDEACEDAAYLHGKLREDCEKFVDEYNEFIEELQKEQPFNITPADILKAVKKGKK